MESPEIDTQPYQHASAVAQNTEDTLNSTNSPVKVVLDRLANQVRQTSLTSSQVMALTNKEPLGMELEVSHEKHLQGLGTLRRLPGELRGPIFTYVLVAGRLELMRVSKVVNHEASPILCAKRTCRLNVGFVGTGVAWQYPAFYIVPAFADRIQNVTFVMNAAASTMRRSLRHHHALRLFAESRLPRKHCRVVFKCTYFFSDIAVCEVLHSVRQYTGFEQVDIKLAIDREQEIRDELINSSMPGWLAFEVEGKKSEVLHLVTKTLSPSLGKTCGFKENGNSVVTFRPRERNAVHLHEENQDHATTGRGVGLNIEIKDEHGFEDGADDEEEVYEAYEDDYVQRQSGSIQDWMAAHRFAA